MCGRALGRGFGCGGEKNADGISCGFWGRAKKRREGVSSCGFRGEKKVPLGVMVLEVKVVPLAFEREKEGVGSSCRVGVEKGLWPSAV